MISTSQIKFVKSLGIQKFRRLHNLFVVEGPKMVGELLKSDFIPVEIFATEPWIINNKDVTIKYHDRIIQVTEKKISRLSSMKTPNQVLATVNIPERSISEKVFSNLLLVLDGISDPGNLGTITRIADWFGIQHMVCSSHTVELYNPKVVQSSMGCNEEETKKTAELQTVKTATKKVESSQLNWVNNIEDAVAQAKDGNKAVLVNFTGSDWCKWCVKLDGEVFSKKEFEAYAKENLVLVKLDFPSKIQQSEETKAYNIAQRDKYQVKGYPTILILDSKGKVLEATGYQPGGPAKLTKTALLPSFACATASSILFTQFN